MAEILINRAPFLTLWAAVVARRLGYDEDEALTLGRAVAGLTAAAKGKRLGILEARSPEVKEGVRLQRADLGAQVFEFMGRAIPCLQTPAGLRALAEATAIDPASVKRYIQAKFGDALESVRSELEALAAAYEPADLDARAMDLYMAMRPATAAGRAGWGQAGRLDLGKIAELRHRA